VGTEREEQVSDTHRIIDGRRDWALWIGAQGTHDNCPTWPGNLYAEQYGRMSACIHPISSKVSQQASWAFGLQAAWRTLRTRLGNLMIVPRPPSIEAAAALCG